MELIQVGEKTYYIKNPTNIGIYLLNETDVYLIDTGNDKDSGKRILKICEAQGWQVKGIINTHSNADHIGGNEVIQKRCACPVFTNGREKCFTQYPDLEPTLLYGGFPFQDLKNKFLMAKPSIVEDIDSALPDGLSYFSLKGHFVDMIGIKTSDDVYFLGDALFSHETLVKYGVFFLYDVSSFLETLEFLKTLKGNLFIPSHVEAMNDLSTIIDENIQKVHEIMNRICFYCKTPKTFEAILHFVFDEFHLNMNLNQYMLVGSTIRSYLAYLFDIGTLGYEFSNNQMFWHLIKGE